MKIQVASYNTQHCKNFISGKIDFDALAGALAQLNADVVGLNEIRSAGERDDYEDQTAILATKAGYAHYYFAKAIEVRGNNPYGNAILSRYPIVSAETVMIPDPPERGDSSFETRCALVADIEIEGERVRFIVTHFGLNESEQINAVETVKNLFSERCVLMGDFNLQPNSGVLAPIRALMRDAAERLGTCGLTFPSDNPTEKIDYIFVGGDIEVACSDVPALIISDHRPHTAELVL